MKRNTRTTPYLALALLAGGLLSGCAYFGELRMRPQLNAADAAFADQEFSLAATRYESLSDRYPPGPRREQMILRQGISLYSISAYHEARDVFLNYLSENPRGLYSQDASVYLNKIDVLMSSDGLVEQAAIDAAKADLNQLQQLRMKHPHDPHVPYAIGNLYYEMGNYDEAVRYYYVAASLDATYKEKALIKERKFIDETGQWHAVTPAETKRMEREKNPLVVFETHSYTERDHNSILYNDAQKRFFQVTGLIRNQSSRLLDNVAIEVRFENAVHQILDVQNVNVGSLGPGEVRAFQAAADNYDDLYNITSYETLPRWGR